MAAGIEKSFATGFRATRIVATPLPTFPSPALNRTKEGGGGVGTGAFADRKFKRSTYLIRWLNGSRSSLEFSSFAFETFNVAPVFGRGIGNEIHESGPQSSVLQQRPYSQKRIPSNRDGE